MCEVNVGYTLYHYNSFVCVGVPYVGSGVSFIGSGRTANAYKHLHTQKAAPGIAASSTGRCLGGAVLDHKKIN
jgi:hypothetical protein|tara:strand:- start:113 stop:331 length:219 start_codon:yes stop_codon:yes gene_type:complete